MYKFRSFYIPKRMMEGLTRYIDHRVEPGGFLKAVISNDLKGAVGLADDENLLNLPAYVTYLYNEAPSLCWGSKENMQTWLKGEKI